MTYIRLLDLLIVLKYIPQNINLRIRLNRNPRLHAQLMNIPNQLLRTRLGLARALRALGCCAGDGGFVVETVKVAASFLELLHPFLWLGYRYIR